MLCEGPQVALLVFVTNRFFEFGRCSIFRVLSDPVFFVLPIAEGENLFSFDLAVSSNSSAPSLTLRVTATDGLGIGS